MAKESRQRVSDGLQVVSWDRAEAPANVEELGWWGGFFDYGMRWHDYLEEFEVELHPYLNKARHSAVKCNIRATGYMHQHEGITPVFSDGTCFALTFRAWGDFMAAVWSEAENRDSHYMEFYV